MEIATERARVKRGRQIEPGWLVSLMVRWSRRSLKVESGALGYPTRSAGFSEKTTGGYNHSNPTTFGIEDFTDLDEALQVLGACNQAQFVSMMMYYKPWIVAALRAEGWAFGDSTYFKRLHAAHAFVAKIMDDKKQKVE